MTLQEIHAYFEKASASGIRPGLDRMRELMRRLGDPQDRLSIIHVAGTNGKGSTSAYMVSILLRAHKKIGWYSSPAVIDERETIRVFDGQGEKSDPGAASAGEPAFRDLLEKSMICDDDYVTAMTSVIEASDEMKLDGWQAPTVYELETAGAFVCFFRQKVDIAVIEVGMGGKNDATNVIKRSLLSVVTPIGLDHMQYLGSSIFQIAGEKAGILSPGGYLVTHQSGVLMGSADPRAVRRQERNRGIILGRLRAEAEEKQARMTEVDRSQLSIDKQDLSGTEFTYRGISYHTRMCGMYQPGNAALAIEAMIALSKIGDESGERSSEGTDATGESGVVSWLGSLTDDVIREGIEEAVMPARFDIISRDPTVIYDGAHNTDGAAALAQTLRTLIPDRRVYAVMGVYKDKAVDDMLSTVLPMIDRIHTVRVPGERGMSARSLAEHIRYIRPELAVEPGGEDVMSAFREVLGNAARDGAVVLVFGTLSLAHDIYRIMTEIAREKTGEYEKTASSTATDTREPACESDRSRVLVEGTGERLSDLLREKGLVLPSPCGGHGTCGKCVVRMLRGDVEMTPAERSLFSNDEIEQGYRLACQMTVWGEAEVELPAEVSIPDVKNSGQTRSESSGMIPGGARFGNAVMEEIPRYFRSSNTYGIAIDIGTTTLAAALVRLSSGQIVDRRNRMNPQVSFGADVITRIRAAGEGQAESMRQMLCEELLSGIETLLVRNGLGYGQLKHVSIAGNTTMLHLLRGYPVDSLGKHPFTPHSLASELQTLGTVFGNFAGWPLEESLVPVPVTILPGISAFVGADIVSGLLALDFDKKDTISILMDLGTNGELVIGNRDRIIVTSTAAGPALEGGNISHGTAGVRGAIHEVQILKSPEGGYQALVNTIGSTPGHPEAPIGICGSGVIGTMAELIRNGLVDSAGLLSEPWFETGFPLAMGQRGESITLTQDDIREIQMAKAAIRAGLDCLPERYGVSPEKVDRFYIAGSFGESMKIEQAVTIGLLPGEVAGRTEIVGNTSLTGAIRVLTEEDAVARAQAIAERAESFNLAADDTFQERYVAEMNFGAQTC